MTISSKMYRHTDSGSYNTDGEIIVSSSSFTVSSGNMIYLDKCGVEATLKTTDSGNEAYAECRMLKRDVNTGVLVQKSGVVASTASTSYSTVKAQGSFGGYLTDSMELVLQYILYIYGNNPSAYSNDFNAALSGRQVV